MKVPEISIIMATYNRAHLISETLLSISNQTNENWECLIIDDGSKDNTREVLIPLLKKDPRFKYYVRSDQYKKGLPGCRNYGLELAKGEYIVFLDDDDIAHPQLLELVLKEILQYDVAYCRYFRSIFRREFEYDFDYNMGYGITHHDQNLLEKMITNEIPFNSCQVLWKKDSFKNNCFNEDLMYAEEWELYSRILSNNPRGITIQKKLLFARKHENSNTGEYMSNDPVRINSMKSAVKLVTEHLKNKNLLSDQLLKYFIQTAFNLKDYFLLESILEISDLSKIKILSYKVVYKLHPIIKPIFKLKAKL